MGARTQISAQFYGEYTEQVRVEELRILGVRVRKAGTKTVKRHGTCDTREGKVVPDDQVAYRRFRTECRLIKAVNVLAGSSSVMVLYLDGWPNTKLDIGNTKFEFDATVDGDPKVTLDFAGNCTLDGPMDSRDDKFVTVTFKDREQMRSFVIATSSTPDPEVVRSGGYRHRSSGSDSSLWPLAAGVVIGIGIS